MGLFIHREAKFSKYLDTLRKSGGAAATASTRAEQILYRLRAEGGMAPEDFSRLTKHGELRIKKCVKYDLGGGYRLVGVKMGGHIIFTFAGSHDDCDRWIENNRGFDPVLARREPLLFQGDEYDDRSQRQTELSEPDYDDLLMARVNERMRRSSFKGLCGNSPS